LLDLRAGSRGGSLDLLLAAASSTLVRAVGSAIDCAVTLTRPGRAPLLAASNETALGFARASHASGSTPVAQALAGHVAVISNGYSPHPDWPGWWRVLADSGYRSMLAAPMTGHSGRPFAALILLSGNDNVFTPPVTATVSEFCNQAASSYHLAENIRAAQAEAQQLREALHSRATIDAACGVIMAQNGCSYELAFQILAKASSHRNIKVRDIADKILDTVRG
jgi:GAF domain-containing protein